MHRLSLLRDHHDLRRGHFRALLARLAEADSDRLLPTLHFPSEPLLSVPFFFRCIADLTRLPAALPYLAMSCLCKRWALAIGLVHDVLGDTAR